MVRHAKKPAGAEKCAELHRLAEMIREAEWRCAAAWATAGRPTFVATGWPDVDASLAGAAGLNPPARTTPLIRGGLACGAIHEWFGVVDSYADPRAVPPPPAGAERPGGRGRPQRLDAESAPLPPWRHDGPWTPPLCILSHLAWQVLEDAASRHEGGAIVWVGRRCWPNPRLLVRDRKEEEPDRRLLERSLFVDPANDDVRLWAMDLALRSAAVAAVVADGSRLGMASTRRLHLAARSRGNIALLARPPKDLGDLSAAATRWLVRRPCTGGAAPRWLLHLVRSRSVQPRREALRSWLLEWNGEKSAVVISSDVVDRPGEASPPQPHVGRAVAQRTA